MYRLYTHNDLDGVGCGILARLVFGNHVDVRYNSVQGLDVQIERFLEKDQFDDALFITDLSVSAENEIRLDEFIKKGGKATLLDHHKSALHLNTHQWGHVQVEYENGTLTSATSLFYQHLQQQHLIEPTDALTQFVELVRQWDTWEWDKNETVDAKRLNDLFFMLSIDEFEERMVLRLQETDHFFFDEFEEKILDMEESKIERYIRRKRREMVQTFIRDHCAGIVHAESYHSELGNELGKENPHLDYIAILNVGGKKISFRTIHDDIDVSQVAGHFGGGGHEKAAGCSINEETYRDYIAEPFALEPVRLDAFRNQYNTKSSKIGSLYHDSEENSFYIYPLKEKWVLEQNGKIVQSFLSFAEAERYIKRHYAAWLVRDKRFVDFLAETVIRKMSNTNVM